MNTPRELPTKGRGAEAWADAKKTADERLAQMWRQARARGAKAFHPDDGWVDKKNGTVRLQYPFVQLPGIGAGDFIAVTDYVDFKLLKVTGATEDPKVFLIEPQQDEEELDPMPLVIFCGLVVLAAYAVFLAIIR
jgi:hypothetical protein